MGSGSSQRSRGQLVCHMIGATECFRLKIKWTHGPQGHFKHLNCYLNHFIDSTGITKPVKMIICFNISQIFFLCIGNQSNDVKKQLSCSCWDLQTWRTPIKSLNGLFDNSVKYLLQINIWCSPPSSFLFLFSSQQRLPTLS